MSLQERFTNELIAQGMPATLAPYFAARLTPKLQETIINTLPEGNTMVTYLGASAVSIPVVQQRIKAAFPNVAVYSYQSYTVVDKIIKDNPGWTEDQVYAEAIKSYLPKAAGGYQVTVAEAQKNITAAKNLPVYLTIGAGILAALLWL